MPPLAPRLDCKELLAVIAADPKLAEIFGTNLVNVPSESFAEFIKMPPR